MRTSVLLLCLALAVSAQEAPPNGPRRIDPGWHALVSATVHVQPGKVLKNTNVVLKDGRIVAVGQAAPPEGARIWDAKGLHVYAGLIDAHVAVEPEPAKTRHWNSKVTPERIARAIDAPTASELRSLGFTAAVAAPKSGILRGRACLVSLAPEEPDRSAKRPTIYKQGAYQALGFDTFRRSDEGYPTSLMGAIAVLRQSFFDGLAKGETLLFDTQDELDALRAARIAREFKRNAILLGSGLEFRRIDAIAKDGLPIILPLRLPPLPRVDSVGARDAVELRELMAWEQAPGNAHRLDAAGMQVAITTSKLKRRAEFFRNLRRALKVLDADRALAMLTTNPSAMLGVSDRMGSVEQGKLANLVVADRPLFERNTRILAVWIDGKRHAVARAREPRLRGEWALNVAKEQWTLRIVRLRGRINVTIGETQARATRLEQTGEQLSFVVEHPDGPVTFSGTVEGDAMQGKGVRSDGSRFDWSGKRTKEIQRPVREWERDPEPLVPETNSYPFGPYALEKAPGQPKEVVFSGATIWTSGPQGIIENGELVIGGGKVLYVGPMRKREPGPDTLVKDARGRHVTPGIIDCHSHTGISRGVNDSGQAVTAEVRIGDVTNPDSISWYRQLAGGVTCVNSLHGSANPIGGQNQVNKIRWGAVHPDDMHFSAAPPGIKFALGENVKQSNWGDDYTKRYPQTRMGVETLMRDRFLAARDYLRGPGRVDLELEALAEVLSGKRLVHCHSYRQDEILMLCRIAEEFGFRIGTFQHILEGYKVAEAIRKHAIGASAFSDWWAYKVEVQDAIPQNGAIMHEVGVVVSFNSDSDDLARRLNLEAAKAVKYGNLPRAEAFKFVTRNAAIQLGIESRVGSLERGKDADIAVWSGDPMSAFSICESTWVDGREYFSLEQDKQHRLKIAAERKRILAKILKQPQRRGRDEEEDQEVQGHWWHRRFHAAVCGECGVGR